MTPRPVRAGIAWLLLVALAYPQGLAAQQEKIAALKQSLAANQKQQRQYKWVETTVISMKGEEKSRLQKQVFYGPDGSLQKQPLSPPPPPPSSPGGLKGKIVEKKKAEITATMKQAEELVHRYVPPDPQRVQAAQAAGNLAIAPAGPGSARLDLKNYLKSGDSLSLGLDTAGNALQTISVKSYLESKDDVVTLDVTYARLRDGLSYAASTVLGVPGEQIQVVIQNSNYQKAAPAGPTAATAPAGTATAPAAKAAAPGTSTAAIDSLTAPIALYPDALIAQILQASTDVPAVQTFAAWLKSNASLKGTALQDAAQKAGFSPSLIALAPFPQVVQMMFDKPDWTLGLGKAFVANKAAVFESIQRLRAMAQAMGNLKTTPQQQVSTETTSSGQQVIVVQPANPQVIYVPVYNTQTVYVQQAPPPSSTSSSNAAAAAMVGFTMGVVIGASSDHYYHGPYAWRGAAMYEEAWDRREDYVDDRQDFAEDRAENAREYQDERRDTAQGSQSERQSTAQANQATRQSATSSETGQANQASRQSTAQTNQATRQSAASSETAQANQANRQSTAEAGQASRQASGASSETAQANQANRQSTAQGSQASREAAGASSAAQANQANRQSTAKANQGSRQGTSYQSAAAARSQSARGSASRSGGSRR